MEDAGSIKRYLEALVLDLTNPDERAFQLLRALDSEPRITILNFLHKNPGSSINILAAALAIPTSTTAQHIKELEKAGLAYTELRPANRGLQKVSYAAQNRQIIIRLPYSDRIQHESVSWAMPIGAYVDCEAVPTCGLATELAIIGEMDNPSYFFHPDRLNAQLLWFRHGFLEYRFPKIIPSNVRVETITFSMEIASEAPRSNEDYPSDVTLWINNVEVGTWTSPGDFGSERGLLTPEWWGGRNSQYGLLKVWKVSDEGSYIDGLRISEVTIDDLDIANYKNIAMRIGVKEDAHYVGGLNLFGRRFGNYPQDIVMTIYLSQPHEGARVPHT